MAESLAPEQGSPPPRDQLSAVKVAFPQKLEDFEKDPRVHYDKLNDKWSLEEEDGSEYEWNFVAKRWAPLVRN